MWTWFLLDFCWWIIALWLWWFGVQAGGAGASHNACLHINSLSFDDVIILLTVFEMLCSVFLKCIARLCFYSAFLLYNLDFIMLRNIVLMPSILHVLSLSIV